MTATVTDPHAILGVRKNASQKAIKRAYRQLALKHHPDRNVGDPDAPERFRQIHEAYAALTGKRTEPDNSETEAYEVLTGVFGSILGQMVEQSVDPKSRDLAALMREGLTNALKHTRESIAKLDKALAALAATRGRFGGKPAESLEGIIEFHLVNTRKQRDNLERQKVRMEAAMKLLKDCTFRYEPQTGTWATATGPSVVFQWRSF